MRFDAEKVLKRVGIGILLVYVVLVGLHMSNGFTFSESLSMPVRDARMAATCPNEPQHVWEFIDRGPLTLGLFGLAGGDVYDLVCEIGLR